MSSYISFTALCEVTMAETGEPKDIPTSTISEAAKPEGSELAAAASTVEGNGKSGFVAH